MSDSGEDAAAAAPAEGAAPAGEAPAEAKPESITIRVKDQSGEEVSFKVKKSTKMQKIMTYYEKRANAAPGSVSFMLDGERVDLNHTVKQLELEEGDQIDAMLRQEGGGAL